MPTWKADMKTWGCHLIMIYFILWIKEWQTLIWEVNLLTPFLKLNMQYNTIRQRKTQSLTTMTESREHISDLRIFFLNNTDSWAAKQKAGGWEIPVDYRKFKKLLLLIEAVGDLQKNLIQSRSLYLCCL